MEPILTILLSGFFGGVIATVVSALLSKKNEKETRLFNVKLEAYKEFVSHIQNRFISFLGHKGNLYLHTLLEAAARCLLVSGPTLNKELRQYLVFVDNLYRKCESADSNLDTEEEFAELWRKGDLITELMRKDLGF